MSIPRQPPSHISLLPPQPNKGGWVNVGTHVNTSSSRPILPRRSLPRNRIIGDIGYVRTPQSEEEEEGRSYVFTDHCYEVCWGRAGGGEEVWRGIEAAGE